MVPDLQVIKLQDTLMTLRDLRMGKVACMYSNGDRNSF